MFVHQLFPSIEELEKKVGEAENTTKQAKEDLAPIKVEYDENAKNIVMAENTTRGAEKESQQALVVSYRS